MSKNGKTGQRATRQHPPTKIIVKRHYVGTEKMETAKLKSDKITALYCGLSKDDGTNYDHPPPCFQTAYQ